MVNATDNLRRSLQKGSGLRLNPEVVAQRMDDVMMLVHMHSNEIYELNSTAARVWELLGSGLGQGEIQEQMLLEYDVDGLVLEREVAETLGLLKEKNLVIQSGEPQDEGGGR